MTDQLPDIIKPSGSLIPLPDGALIPALIADAGERASWRYVEFFTANIRIPNTRRRTTKLYDRTKERLTQDEVERIRFLAKKSVVTN